MEEQFKQLKAVPLCDEQLEAVKRIEECNDPAIILTGEAGSGKSTVVKHLLKKHSDWALCATTGRAALLIGGVTVDRLFALNRRDWELDYGRLARYMDSIGDTIILDEASMVGAKMADLLYEAITEYNKRLVLVGDWGQAEPVKDEWPFDTQLYKDIQVVKLQENHRQDDEEYLTALRHLRRGEAVKAGSYFIGRVTGKIPPSTIVLVGTNAHANKYNERAYNKLSHERELYLEAEFIKDRYLPDEDKHAALADQAGIANGFSVCKDCRVLITWNLRTQRHPYTSVVNGDTGVVVDTDSDKGITVLLDRGEEAVLPKLDVVQVNEKRQPMYRIRGYPLRLGWSVTIHKSQGQTMTRAAVDTDLGFYHKAYGLLYVALSRTVHGEDLYLSKWRPEKVASSPAVQWLL